MSLQLVSLFAGVGGFDIAAERVGIDPVVACEIDPQARGVLQHRFQNTTLINDVKDVTGERLTELGLDPKRTIITGGFPCQDLSIAGKQAGLEGGERSSLFFEIVRILREFNPQWFILENVPGLLSSKGGRDMGIVIGSLAELGYSFSWRVLDAQNFGVPQRRRRVFIVGHFGTDATRAEQVLFESEGSRGDFEAGHAKGQDTTGNAVQSTYRNSARIIGPLNTRMASPRGTETTDSGHLIEVEIDSFRMLGFGDYEPDDTASALKARDYKDATDLIVPFIKSRRAQTDQDVETWIESKVTPTLNRIDNTGESYATVLIHNKQSDGDVRLYDDISPTVTRTWGTGGNNVPMIETKAYGLDSEKNGWVEKMGTLTARANSGGIAQVVAYSAKAHPGEQPTTVMGDKTHTLTAEGHDASEDGTGRGTPIVATPTTVRRLTPLECERLQGFPDGWSAQRVDHKKGVVVNQADSSRYKQMGNAVAVPVVEWILGRLNHVSND